VGDFAVLMGWADQVMAETGRISACGPMPIRLPNALSPGSSARRAWACAAPSRCSSRPSGSTRCDALSSPEARAREKALDHLLHLQRDDFRQIFQDMAGLPVAIRLLDLPLHGFLPESQADMATLAESLDIGLDKLRRLAGEMHEFNPLLGLRGCRLGIAYPELYAMQLRALFEAACEAAQTHAPAQLEVMVPLVSSAAELAAIRVQVDRAGCLQRARLTCHGALAR
jgi:pyruvate,orthophosphate dikinase